MTDKTKEAKKQLDVYYGLITKLHEYLKTRNRFPHEGQYPIIRSVFEDKKKVVMGQCGRSAGKTESILYIAHRYGLLNPGSQIYIICPERKQGKEIYWASGRLQGYAPREFTKDLNKDEIRKTLYNDSFICIEGCENIDGLRGIKPHLVIYDEFQHHSAEFDLEVMRPNLSAKNSSLVVMGTPPKTDCYYVEFRKDLLEQIAGGDEDLAYIELPTEVNPTVDKDWLMKEKARLYRVGKEKVWLREYMGELHFDTEGAVFPTFSRESHVRPRSYLRNIIGNDANKWEWWAIYDPGTVTVFAALFMALNRETSQVLLLDEIYEKDRRLTNARNIWETGLHKKRAFFPHPDRWNDLYDEAASWFANEIQSLFNVGIMPTAKQTLQRRFDEGRPGESLINSVLLGENKLFVAEECTNFLSEMEGYVTRVGRNGELIYPKKNDHLIDCLFYFFLNSNYDIFEGLEEEEEEVRFATYNEALGRGFWN